MNTSKQSAVSKPTIATPVAIEDIDFGNKSAIVDASGERIIVCNAEISKELIALINSQRNQSTIYDNESLFEVSSEIWDQVGYLEYDLKLPKGSP